MNIASQNYNIRISLRRIERLKLDMNVTMYV